MRAVPLGFHLAYGLSRLLPPAAACALADGLSDWHWRLAAADRRAVQANLAFLHGAAARGEAGQVREVFRNFGRYLLEFFTLTGASRPPMVEGADHLAAARRGGRGAIILTAHLGNWELGAAFLRRMGLPMTVVALPHADTSTDRLFNRLRQRRGLEVIRLGEPQATLRCLASLRAGRCLGVLGDRDFSGQEAVVQICGRSVRLPRGPATLSLRADVPVVPVFLIREGHWRFRLYIEPPIWPRHGERPTGAIARLTQAYAAVIERYLTRFPEQWLMFRSAVDGWTVTA